MTAATLRRMTARRAWAAVAAAALGAAAGCASVPSGFPCAEDIQGKFPDPNGTSLREYRARQVLKAREENYVFYQYEWLYDEPTRLGPFGTNHFNSLAKAVAQNGHAVVIEPSGDPKLDAARAAVMVAALTQAGVAGAQHLVYVTLPRAEGLYGEEAPGAYQQLINGASGVTGAGGLGAGPGGLGMGAGGAGAGGLGGGGAFGGQGVIR